MDTALQVLQLFNATCQAEALQASEVSSDESEAGDLLSCLCPQLLRSRRVVSKSAAPNLDAIEDFLQARKRRRVAGSEGGLGHTSVEPWTAVGTILNPDTLEIHCRPERGTSNMPSADAEECCKLWAAAVHDASTGEDADDDPVAIEQQQVQQTVGLAGAQLSPCQPPSQEGAELGSEQPTQEVRVTGSSGEAEFRQHASSLLSGLQPFDFLKAA